MRDPSDYSWLGDYGEQLAAKGGVIDPKIEKEIIEGPQPRYETLELVVPERDKASAERRAEEIAAALEHMAPTRRSLLEVVGIVLQTVAWFLIGVLIGYTMASS